MESLKWFVEDRPTSNLIRRF